MTPNAKNENKFDFTEAEVFVGGCSDGRENKVTGEVIIYKSGNIVVCGFTKYAFVHATVDGQRNHDGHPDNHVFKVRLLCPRSGAAFCSVV